MIRSKSISDYFDADLRDIRSGKALTFDVHLYFPGNQHILLWKRAGETLSEETLDRFINRGVQKVWIHVDDRSLYEAYREGKEEAPEKAPQDEAPPEQPPQEEAPASAEPEAEGPAEDEGPRTEEGAFMRGVLQTDALGNDEKEAILAEAARAVLAESAAARDAEAQKRADEKARQTIQDVLDATAEKAESAITEVWKLARLDSDLEHSVNVATYAVIFAMAFGRIDSELISDLALAGLIHDVGVSQIPIYLSSQPRRTMKGATLKEFASHVDHGLKLIEKHAPDTSERVKTIIRQHHEKFDGSGYPKGLSGFKVDDVAQLLAMADLLDTLISGGWDGQKRTMSEAFQKIEELEKARTFPEHFNPEVFSAVMRWIRSQADEQVAGNAARVVGSQAQEIVKRK